MRQKQHAKHRIQQPMPPQPEVFSDHVKEFRQRLTVVVVAFLIGGGGGYLINKQVTLFLVKPLHQALYYTTPGGGFSFIMKICTMFGIMVCLPVAIYNIISFIQPAFKKSISRSEIRFVTVLSFLLAIGGSAFAYYEVLPASFRFFGGFSTNGLHSLITASEYLKFVTNAILTFAVLFQVPLIILFINRIKRIPPKIMLKYEKYVVVGSLAIAVILPFSYDPIMQFLVAIPIIGLYNVSLIAVWVVNRRHDKAHPNHQFAPVAAPRPAPRPRPAPIAAPAEPAPRLQPLPQPVAQAAQLQPAPTPITLPQPAVFKAPRYAIGFEFTPTRPARSFITLPRSEY